MKGFVRLKEVLLPEEVLVDISKQDPEKQLEYSNENAHQLVENSSEFDNWLNEVVFDLEHFRTAEQEEAPKKAEAVSGP